MDRTLAAFARAGVPLIISSGNHDSAVRLQYGGAVMAQAGIHVRTSLGRWTEPVVLSDEHGRVGVYGIPYLLPDAVSADWGSSARTRRSSARWWTGSGTTRRSRGLSRTRGDGARLRDRRRRLRLRARHPGRGSATAPAGVFDGVHLRRPGASARPAARAPAGLVDVHRSTAARRWRSPSPRGARQVGDGGRPRRPGGWPTRRVARARAPTTAPGAGPAGGAPGAGSGDLAGLADAWVKVVLTDPGRVGNPDGAAARVCGRTRSCCCEFAPRRCAGHSRAGQDGESVDPVEICAQFIEAVSELARHGSGQRPDPSSALSWPNPCSRSDWRRRSA